MKKYANKIAMLVVASCVLVLFFQNCGQAGFEGEDMTLDNASTGNPQLKNLPFPYEISINQLAYMSCPMNSGTGANDQTFTFKVGAYDNTEFPAAGMGISAAGVKISSDFFNQFTTMYSAYSEDVKKNKLAEALSTAPNAINATPYLSLRSINGTKVNPFYYQGYSTTSMMRPMLGVMSDMAYTQTFRDRFAVLPAQPISFFNYAKYTSNSPLKSLNGAISMPNSQNQRVDLGGNYLTVGFVNTNVSLGTYDSPTPFGPDTGDDNMYGRGLSLDFINQNEGNANYRGFHRASRAMIVRAEYDLATATQAAGTWDCSRAFKIVPEVVRAELMNSPVGAVAKCPVESFAQRNVAANLQTYHLLRRFLNSDNWDINVSRRCVVQKSGTGAGSCYGSRDPKTIVMDELYYQTPQPGVTPTQYAGCSANADDGFQLCPHYLTLCIKR